MIGGVKEGVATEVMAQVTESDALARTTALSVDRSFIVQAPAGSGKTGLLVYRMLSLLATVVQPQQVLAITFTRKATAEMRARVLELMVFAEQDQTSDDPFEQQGITLACAVLAQDKKHGWQLLNSPQQLQILTIDSFCSKLASSMPWLSRLGDRPRTTDQAESHYAAAVEQLLSELLNDDSPLTDALRTVLFELDFNYNKARSLFISMLAKRDQWLRHLLQHDADALRISLESAWQGVVAEHITHLNQTVPDSTLQILIRLALEAAPLVKRKEGKLSPLQAFEDYSDTGNGLHRSLNIAHWQALRNMLLVANGETFRKTVNISLGFPPKMPATIEMKALLEEFASDDEFREALQETALLPTLAFGDDDWQKLLALETVLKSLAAFLQLRFRSTGECDHSEVTQRANLALQELDNPTDLALRMDYQLQHILVDEFQDTSHGQLELLKRLTAGWSEGHDARTLFLVGDPMQSIYRFREADVSLFLRVADNQVTRVFSNIEIESLTLTENFRSSSTLVDWFNEVFNESFPAQNNVLSGAISYARATSSKADFPDCVSYQLAHDKAQQAELVVNALQQALENLPKDGSQDNDQIAVLVRSRSQLKALLPSIHAAGIAYTGVDIKPLKEQQAVIDLLALCKAICREDDRVSWLALLRGPWCGLTLVELKQLVGRQDQTVWQQLSALPIGDEINNDEIDADLSTRLTRFIDLMRRTTEQRQQVELSSLTRWAWRALGGEQTLYDSSLDDIETVIGLIQDLQRGGDLPSIKELDKALDGLYAQSNNTQLNSGLYSGLHPDLDIDKQVPKVVISTMHKSKGLQFDTVILPSLGTPSRAEDKEVLMWAERQNAVGESELLLAPLRLEEGKDAHYNYLRNLDKKRGTNEAIRLMYVACTRAERKLVLIATSNADQETQAPRPPNKGSLLATIWNAIDTDFAFITEASDVGSDDQQVYSQVLSRLPADFKPHRPEAVQWQVQQQLNAQVDVAIEGQTEAGEIEYQWATEVATAVGIVLHNWLQFNTETVLTVNVDQNLLKHWRVELTALRVPYNRIDSAIQRLKKAVSKIQDDTDAHFLFTTYSEQCNEYSLATFEQGMVNTYRIDRTFVDQHNVRWIVDYKSTDTRNEDVVTFVDQQVAERHKQQLEKYGALMCQVDDRPIKLAIYFPMLAQLRSWDYPN